MTFAAFFLKEDRQRIFPAFDPVYAAYRSWAGQTLNERLTTLEKETHKNESLKHRRK
jgi:hypothetical protein